MSNFLANIAASIAIAVSSILGGGPSVQPAPVVPAEQPTQVSATTYRAIGTYSNLGQSISYSLEFPIAGGEIAGSFSGSCSGKVMGNYNSVTYTVDGTVSGSCDNILYKGNFNQGFSGAVDKQSQLIHVQVKSDNSVVQKLGQADLPLSSR